MIFKKIREKVSEYFKGKLIKDSWDIVQFNSDIISIVNQVQNEYNNGWISVENELPEKFDDVLVSCEGNIVGGTHEGEKCEFVATGYMFSKDHWQIQGHSDVKYIKVLAWQPLPEFYTPKGE